MLDLRPPDLHRSGVADQPSLEMDLAGDWGQEGEVRVRRQHEGEAAGWPR